MMYNDSYRGDKKMKYENRDRKQNRIKGKKVTPFKNRVTKFHSTKLSDEQENKRNRNKRLKI